MKAAAAVLATRNTPRTPIMSRVRRSRDQKLGRTRPGTFHTSAMAYWPAWIAPWAPQISQRMPMTRPRVLFG